MTDEYSRQEKLPMRPTSRAGFYAAVYPSLAEVARAHGYALAIHGSLARDFDLVAIPWAEVAAEPLALVQALKEATGAVVHRSGADHLFTDLAVTQRPHGRLSYSLHFTDDGMWGPYLDISVAPRSSDDALCQAHDAMVAEKNESARLRSALQAAERERDSLAQDQLTSSSGDAATRKDAAASEDPAATNSPQLEALLDCGQPDAVVCATANGCQRHWVVRNRELLSAVRLALQDRDSARAEAGRLAQELADARALSARVSEFGLSNEIEALEKVDARDATIARLREALEFYGAAETWRRFEPRWFGTPIGDDMGKRAREALGK